MPKKTEQDLTKKERASKPSILDKNSIYIELAKDKKDNVRAALAENPDIDISIQKLLAADSNSYVLECLARNSNIDRDVILNSLLAVKDVDALRNISLALSGNSNIPSDIAEKLVQEKYQFVHDEKLVENKALSEKTRKALSERIFKNDSAEDVAQLDLNIFSEINCEKLLKSEDEYVRKYLACNRTLPISMQLALAKDKSESVRECLAGNSSLQGKTIKVLSKDKSVDVRRKLAGNEAIDQKSLDDLLKDDEEYVHWALTNNRSSSIKTLEYFSKSKDSELAAHAQNKLNWKTMSLDFERIMKDGDVESLILLALNKNTPLAIITKILAKYKPDFDNWQVCVSLAQNPVTSSQLLSELSHSKDTTVLEAVAANINTDIATLASLSKHKDANVRQYVANPNWYKLPPFLSEKMQ